MYIDYIYNKLLNILILTIKHLIYTILLDLMGQFFIVVIKLLRNNESMIILLSLYDLITLYEPIKYLYKYSLFYMHFHIILL